MPTESVVEFLCCPECLAFQGYEHHINCDEVEYVPRATTYDRTPVDCLISELRDSFFPVLSKTSVLTLAQFDERVAQFEVEVRDE